uniref:Uncharacterized protein n=1 Tax=Nymphaea colorata TaxID=210225 RepID=A0A5K0X9U8_9MAGN
MSVGRSASDCRLVLQLVGMEEVKQYVVLRFGEGDSSLLDPFELVSLQMQLNLAIMGRSYSTPNPARFFNAPSQFTQAIRRRRWGLPRALKKLLRPLFAHHHQPEKATELEDHGCQKQY